MDIDALLGEDLAVFDGLTETDSLLLRRLSLDLRLTVPTQEELDEFLKDDPQDRWPRWVQRFLDHPLHAERMVDWLDKTLLQRRPHVHVDRLKWLTYLRQVVDDRRPLDQIVRESIEARWWTLDHRAQQRFYLDRAGDPHALTRDIGRVFFGRDMQCAQCHDHPQVDDYLQIDYHGLLAFVSPSSLMEAKFKDDKGAEQKIQIYAERAAGDAAFESVFDKGVLFRTGVRGPKNPEQFDLYQAPDGRYVTTRMPDSLDGAPNPPLSSRRAMLADQTSANNRSFAENWANRIWALMMGTGLVHPLDMHHADNPPSNPQLLDALTGQLIASGFDTQALIQQIALSRAYRRGSKMQIEEYVQHGSVLRLPEENRTRWESEIAERKQALENSLAPLALAAKESLKKVSESASNWRAAQKERVNLRAELDKTEGVFQEVMKKRDESITAFDKAKKLLDDATAKTKLLEEAHDKLAQAIAIGMPPDPDLQAAMNTTKAKAEAAKTSLAALEKGVLDATALREANTPLLETERVKVLEVTTRLQPIELKLHAADEVFVAARSLWQKDQSQYTSAVQRNGELSRLQTWLASSQAELTIESEQALAVQSKTELVGAAIEACNVAMQQVINDRQRDNRLAPGRPLSPEQLGLSILQATNVLGNYIAVETTELEKTSPLAADADPKQRASRTLQATRQALDKLRGNIDQFSSLYASGVGQTSDEFFASPDQALFMANGGSVFQWSAPSGNNVAGRVVQQADSNLAAITLFRSLLSREPTERESQWCNELLCQAGDQKSAIAQELVWSLLTCSEFRVYP